MGMDTYLPSRQAGRQTTAPVSKQALADRRARCSLLTRLVLMLGTWDVCSRDCNRVSVSVSYFFLPMPAERIPPSPYDLPDYLSIRTCVRACLYLYTYMQTYVHTYICVFRLCVCVSGTSSIKGERRSGVFCWGFGAGFEGLFFV